MSEPMLAANACGSIGRAFKPVRYELHSLLGWLPIRGSSHLPQEKAIRPTAIFVSNDKHTDSKSLWISRFIEEVFPSQNTWDVFGNAAIHFPAFPNDIFLTSQRLDFVITG